MSRTIRRMPLAILTIILTVLLLFSCLLGLKLGYPCFASFGKCASFGYRNGRSGCGLGSSAPAHPARAGGRDGAFAVRHGDAGDAPEDTPMM